MIRTQRGLPSGWVGLVLILCLAPVRTQRAGLIRATLARRNSNTRRTPTMTIRTSTAG